MSKIYLHVDFFVADVFYNGVHPSPLRDDESRYLHVVVQPMLIEAPGGAVDSPGIKDYLDWTGTKITADTVAPLGPALYGQLDRKTTQYTPVPFPPGTILSLSVNGGAAIARTIGASPSLFLLSPTEKTDWSEFAFRNYLSIPIRLFSDLNSAQKGEFLDWSYHFALNVRKLVAAGRDDHYLQTAKDVDRDLLHGLDKGDSRDDWYAALTPLQASLFTWLWKRFDQGSLAPLPDFTPPRFKYDLDRARITDPAVLFGGAFTSYHQLVWNGMRAPFKQGGTAEQKVRDALRRLYGFGERLRWPAAYDDPVVGNHFMVVAKNEEDDPARQGEAPPGRKWLVTNAHSLLGQVFRVGPFDPAQPLARFDLKLAVQDVTIDFDSAADLAANGNVGVASGAIELWRNASALRAAGTVFKTVVQPDNDPRWDNDALAVYYVPQNAPARDAGFKTPKAYPGYDKLRGLPEDAQVFAVPGALLDALEPRARVEFPPADRQPPGVAPALRQATPPRTLIAPAELYGTDLSAFTPLAQVKIKLRRVPLATVTENGQLFQLSLTSALHEPDDLSDVRSWFANSNDRDRAALWLHDGGNPTGAIKALDLAGRVLQSTDDEHGPTLLVFDDVGLLAPLFPVAQGAPATELIGDLVFKVSASERFNWLVKSDGTALAGPPPLLLLRDQFVHQVSASAERLVGHYLVDAQVTPSPAPDGPALRHFTNFNKLRLALVNGGDSIDINHPDALIPERETAATAPFHQFHYKVAHQFTEEVKDVADDGERAHYRLFQSAGDAWKLKGRIEHQYGYRVDTNPTGDQKMARAGDLRDPASVTFWDDGDASAHREPAVEHLLCFDHRADRDAIQLMFNRDYFEKLLRDYRAGIEDHPPADQVRPARLRALYEMLMDLADGQSQLVLERWVFDNSVALTPPASAGDVDTATAVPPLASHMRYVESGTYELSADLDFKAKLLGLVSGDFTAFVGGLAQVLKNDATFFWTDDRGAPPASDQHRRDRGLYVSLKKDDRRWTWSGAIADSDRYPIAATTNAVRIGARIRRAPEKTIKELHFEAGQFIPLALVTPSEDPPPRLPGQEAPPYQFPDLTPLKGGAQRRFADYLQPDSPLFTTFDWLPSVDLDRPLQSTSKYDAGRIEKLFGDLTPTLNFPRGELPAVPHPVELYYVLYDFRPLAPHPAFGDIETIEEFAEYLLEILDDLVNGRPLTNVKLTAASISVAHALDARRRAQAILRDRSGIHAGVAAQLCGLIARVDNVAQIDGDPRARRVNQLALALAPALGDALTSTFTAEPGLYASSKAIAMGLLDPASFTTRLHSLQVVKHLRDVKESNPKTDDTDRFTFHQMLGTPGVPPRFFIDPLDLATYDDHFDVPLDGTTARDAGDVIEQANLFSPPGVAPAAGRLITARVVAHNPTWPPAPSGAPRYKLPSRRFPSLPTPVIPTGGDEDHPAWLTHFVVAIPDEQSGGAPADLDALFKSVQKLTPKSIQLAPATAGGSPIVLPRDPSTVRFQPTPQCGPWYHVEAHLLHFCFVVDSDESGVFDNDCFEIEVQCSERAPEPMKPSVPPNPPDTTSKLMPWFLYDRSRKQHADAKQPDPLALDDLIAEIDGWLREASQQPKPVDGTLPWPNQPPVLLQPSLGSPPPPDFKPQTRYFPKQGDSLRPTQFPAPGKADPGWVFAAALHPLAGQTSAVLCVSIVAEPWFHSRLRVRQRRNVQLDARSDDLSDFNPELEMATRITDWVSYGRHVLRLSSEDLDMLPRRVKRLVAGLTLDTWVHAADSDLLSFGPVHVATREQFGTIRAGKLDFWNYDQALREGRPVWGTVVQVFDDLHPRRTRLGPEGNPLPKLRAPERTDTIARQFLPRGTAEALEKLTTNSINKGLVRTVSPQVRIVWYSSDAADPAPLLEVTWPVQFSS